MCLNSYSEHWKRKDLLESNQPELLTELSDNQCVHTASHSLTHSLTQSSQLISSPGPRALRVSSGLTLNPLSPFNIKGARHCGTHL